MPVFVPNANTQISHPDIANPNRDLLLRALLQGQQTGGDIANKLQSQAQESDLNQQGKQQDVSQLTDLIKSGKLPEGASAALGQFHVGQDPTAKLAQNQSKQEATARSQAIKTYNDRTKPLDERINSAKEMVDALNSNSPNAGAKVVQAYMGMQGFKRFNTPEAYRLADPSIKERMSALFTKFGVDPEKALGGGLNEVQSKMFAKDAMDTLGSFKDEEQGAKDVALSGYKGQSFATPQGLNSLDSNLGGTYSKRASVLQDQLKKHIPQQPALGEQQAPAQGGSGIFKTLKDLLGSPQQAQAPQQPSWADQAAQEIAKRAAAKAQGGP